MIIIPITEKDYGTWPFELQILSNNGPGIKKSDTGMSYAYEFAKFLADSLKEQNDIDIAGKKVLDIGMGNANVLHCVTKCFGADVYGFDLFDYVENRYKDRTFPNTDIRDMPIELFGTFDVAYQRYFSIPYKDITSVLLTIARALKPDGVYFVTFDDTEYICEDPFILKMLNEIYENIYIGYKGRTVIASNPRLNPVVTPAENYYYILTDEEYVVYNQAIKSSGMEEARKLYLYPKKAINQHPE